MYDSPHVTLVKKVEQVRAFRHIRITMAKSTINPTDASIILTYRCPMRCQMCNIWQNPTDKAEEIKAEDLKTLPKLKFINLTGGEPFC